MNYYEASLAVVNELWHFVLNGFSYAERESTHSYVPVHFEAGVSYGAGHSVTTKVRLLLTGEYSEVDILRPLQPSEYISFLLSERAVVLPKPAKHWLPGSWHTNVKGAPDVHVSVVPTEGSVMEYFDDNHDGQLGIVTEVTDDLVVTFQSLGLYNEGEVEVHELPKTVWQELRPVFITFNTTNKA